ncbi:MAG: 2OG-Fe(II) oxygenase [Pseudomonadota bacterium]
MTTLTHDLAGILSTIRRDGSFYATGTTDCAIPVLEVDGVGRISLPLLQVQAEQLIAVATRSPYGRGQETLVDTKVRKTWQIPAERIGLSGRSWLGTLDGIVARAAAGLGVTEPVSAELYKLLVYDTGSFFVEHRDTEKSGGMFATLVVNLPSVCSGGELIVRHKGHEVCLNLSGAEPGDASFAAFYADCVHEVRPVTEGYRLTLVYNLLRKDDGPAPTLPEYDEQSRAITALLGQWVQNKHLAHDETPDKLIYPLEHAYTSAELAFDALKNADAAAAAALVPAATAADCELHLALVSIEESGSAEHDYAPRGRSRWYRNDDYGDRDEDFEIGEVFERSLTVSHWRTPDGALAEIGALPFLEEELCPPDSFEDMEPDEQYFHEATGNEGASFERTYQRAALVLWPRERKLAVLNQAGLPVTLPYLADLARRWMQSGEGKDSTLWCDAHVLSGHMLANWPTTQRYAGAQADRESGFLSSLTRLNDTERINGFLAEVSALGRYCGPENAALVGAMGVLHPQRAAELLEHIVARNAHMLPGACANLLARMVAPSASAGGNTPALLRPAAAALVETLLGERDNAHPSAPWQRPAAVEPSLVDDLLYALAMIDAESLAERLVDYALASDTTFGPDTILVPAMLLLTEREHIKKLSCVERLRATCLGHLRTRATEPLAPPADFARPCALACRCKYCAELGRFLADTVCREWVFKAAESHRRHVEASIRQGGCDLDLATRRQGNPHSLVATKNQASYERRVVQRKNDLTDLARLNVAR